MIGLAAALLAGPPAEAAKCPRGTLTAVVTHVRDGDTIEVGGTPIRLQGLAAPEGDEPGGDQATTAMEGLVLHREVRCELDRERPASLERFQNRTDHALPKPPNSRAPYTKILRVATAGSGR